jgi:hypothetical protein
LRFWIGFERLDRSNDRRFPPPRLLAVSAVIVVVVVIIIVVHHSDPGVHAEDGESSGRASTESGSTSWATREESSVRILQLPIEF